MKLYPYKQGSASAKSLADSLAIKQIRHEGKPIRVVDAIINWGCSNVTREFLNNGLWFNKPVSVACASNKLHAFQALSDADVSVPEWHTDKLHAEVWVADEDIPAVCRTKLNGHSGNGIVIASKLDQIVDAPLYTKYIKKKDEYRIHVFKEDAFFVQRKARKLDVPDGEVNWKVRNLAGGFIFAHKDVEVDDAARVQAVAAVHALSLDFGAVDIIHGTDGVFYVLEVNTAPGLCGATLDAYVEKFKQYK